MAKHAHRLLLNQKKTWRCTLPNCRYFIHVGLAHILPGQQSICWGCGEEFELNEAALNEDQPNCSTCRIRRTGIDVDEMSSYVESQLALAKAGVKSAKELDPIKRRTLENIGGYKFTDDDSPKEPDQVEVIETSDE